MKRKRIGKAVLSLTLVAAMCLPFTAGYQGQLVAAASTVWSGGTAAEYAGGQGTQEDPYQIATGEQLALLVQTDATATAGKYYVLTEDIRLNDTSAEDWKQSATPWVQSDVSFRGQLDGQGHVVEGLFIDADVTTTTRAGLFCFIGPGAVVKNVGIVKADLKAKFVGSIAAYIEHMDGTPPRISNCFAASSVKIQGADVGGLVGATPRPVCMEDSFFTGSLTATGKKGGLVGSLWGLADTNNTVIRRCYVYGENRDSALGNVSAKMVLENVYATQGQYSVTELEPGHMIGDAAKTSMTGFDFDTVWRTVEGGTPQLLAFPLFDDSAVWSGGTAAEYAGGQGTQGDPYQIATGEQLALLVQTDATATAGKYYVLTEDIRLNDTSAEDWKQSATPWVQSDVSFRGQLDGQGHVVEGLFIDADVTTTTRAGLFCFIGPGAVVKNVGIVKADLKAKFVGSIAAYIEHMDGTPPRISNCFAASSVKIQGADVGGLVGATPRPVCMEDSFFTGSLTATGKKGGLVGSLWGAADANNTVIRRCYVYGENRDSALGNVSTKMVLENVYATRGQTGVTELEPGHMIGDTAKTSMTGFDFDTVWRTVEGGTPQLLAFPLFDDTREIPPGENMGTPGTVWTGKIASKFTGGTGTQTDPYQIATGEQLALLASTCLTNSAKTARVYYVLTEDIRLNNTADDNWYSTESVNPWFHTTGAESFRGYFNGQGHIVEGLYVDAAAVAPTNAPKAGLFAVLRQGAVVENVGIVKSFISANYAGGIAGYVENNAEGAPPLIRGCFVNHDVMLQGSFTGGIIAGSPRPVTIEDCYSIANSEGSSRKGGIIGSYWATEKGGEIRRSYSAGLGTVRTLGNDNDVMKYSDVYGNIPQNGVTQVNRGNMIGEKAKTSMKGLDFDGVWKTVDKRSPVLRSFGSDAYSMPLQKVTITFYTNGGPEVAPISGYPEEPITWPEMKRVGYVFDEWHVYRTLDVKYPLDVFPEYDITLYAKWTDVSIRQGFESYPFLTPGEEGLGQDYEVYRPGTIGYDGTYVHDGNKSIHRIGKEAGTQDFTLFDEEMGGLTIGNEYRLSFWVYRDSVHNGSDSIQLVQTDYLDVSRPSHGNQTICKLDQLKQGEWQEVVVTFIAQTKYLSLRTPGLSSLYFDDAVIASTGRTGGIIDSESGNESGSADTGVAMCTGALVTAVAAGTAAYALRRRRTRVSR